MTVEQLDISPLQRAVERLDEGWTRYQRDVTDEQIRDGLVQRFEFTYEISHKLLRRYLQATSANPEQYVQMTFQDLIRSGNEQGLLLGDWPVWRRYREMRSKTSHTYDESVALEVVSGIPDFLEEARYLSTKLQQLQA